MVVIRLISIRVIVVWFRVVVLRRNRVFDFVFVS